MHTADLVSGSSEPMSRSALLGQSVGAAASQGGTFHQSSEDDRPLIPGQQDWREC